MRFRLTVTAVREYEVNPQDYPAGCSVEAMLHCDRDTIRNDPDAMRDHLDGRLEIQIEEVK